MLDCFPVNWRSGVGIITLTAIRSFSSWSEARRLCLYSKTEASAKCAGFFFSAISDARECPSASGGNFRRSFLVCNSRRPNIFRYKFGAIILELPGSQILWNTLVHTYDHVAVPRPGVLAVEFAGPRRMVRVRMIPP